MARAHQLHADSSGRERSAGESQVDAHGVTGGPCPAQPLVDDEGIGAHRLDLAASSPALA